MTKYKNEIEDLFRYLDDNNIRRITKSTVSELEDAGFDYSTLNTLRQNINDNIGKFGQIKIGSTAEKLVKDMQIPKYSKKLTEALMTIAAINRKDLDNPLLREWVEERVIETPGMTGKDGSEIKEGSSETVKSLNVGVMDMFAEKYGEDVFEEIGVGFKNFDSVNDIAEVIEKADWRATPLTIPEPTNEGTDSDSVEDHLRDFREKVGLKKDGTMDEWKPTYTDEVEGIRTKHQAAIEKITDEIEAVEVLDSPTLPEIKLPGLRKMKDARADARDLRDEVRGSIKKTERKVENQLAKGLAKRPKVKEGKNPKVSEDPPNLHLNPKAVGPKLGPVGKDRGDAWDPKPAWEQNTKGPVGKGTPKVSIGISSEDFIRSYLDGDTSAPWPSGVKTAKGPWKGGKPKTKELETTMGGGAISEWRMDHEIKEIEKERKRYEEPDIPDKVRNKMNKQMNQMPPKVTGLSTTAQDVEERLKLAGTGKADPSIEMTPKYGKIKS